MNKHGKLVVLALLVGYVSAQYYIPVTILDNTTGKVKSTKCKVGEPCLGLNLTQFKEETVMKSLLPFTLLLLPVITLVFLLFIAVMVYNFVLGGQKFIRR